MGLNKHYRRVLEMIADRTDRASSADLDPGCVTSSATFADTYNVFVHWRTARALYTRGLVVFPYRGSGDEGDYDSIALTAEGWKAIDREPLWTPPDVPRRYCKTCDFYTDHVSTAHDGLLARGLLRDQSGRLLSPGKTTSN